MSEIPIRSATVPVVLVGAALLGVGIGTWLGRVGSDAPRSSAAIATPSVSPTLVAPSSTTPDASASPRPSGLIFEQQGSTDATTDPFVVDPGWQITWRTDGDSFAFSVSGDQDIGTIVDKRGPASGVTSLAPGGMFQIEVKAVGSWSIVVANGPG